MQAVSESRQGTTKNDKRRQKDLKILKKVLDKQKTMC